MEQLFGSKTRIKLLNLFLRNPRKIFYVRELARMTGDFINSIRRELENLKKLGLLKSHHKDGKRFYQVNSDFFLFEEITALFSKAEVFFENELINKLKDSANIDYMVFTGIFTGAPTSTDILLVGKQFNDNSISEVLDKFTEVLGRQIKYTLMDTEEFNYRQSITDTFVFDILLNKKIVMIDKLGVETPSEE